VVYADGIAFSFPVLPETGLCEPAGLTTFKDRQVTVALGPALAVILSFAMILSPWFVG
jgi:hypothetical protein